MSILPPWERKAAELVDAPPAPDATLDLGTATAGPSAPPSTAPPGTQPDAGSPAAVPPAGRSALLTRWDAVPLRDRLVAILVAALLAALAVTGYGVQAVLRGYLVGQIDNQLRSAYAEAQRNPGYLNVLTRPRGDDGPGGPGPTSFATTVIVPDAPTLSRSTVPPNQSPPVWAVGGSAESEDLNGRLFTLAGSDGHPWHAVAITATVADRSTSATYPATVVLALPLRGVDEAVEELRLKTLLIGGLAILLVVGIGWFAIRRSFAPLREVEATAARIAAGDLSQRVPERPESTEVGSLTTSLNTMLGKIENAFRAQEASESRTRRFAADASHELRTPLASIRGFAELYRQGAVPEDEVPRTMRRIEDEAKRMGGLVEDLLLLARLDERRPGRSEPVDLAVLADDAVHDARGLDPERVVRLVGLSDDEISGPAVVVGDEDRLRQVVANLVSNAVRHTPPGTPIEVAVGTDGGHAVLEVRDHGLGLTAEQSERVFERFYRVDSSRHRGSGGGSGLGLSIVAAVVAAHSGEVAVRPTAGGGATFTVRMPAAVPDERPQPR